MEREYYLEVEDAYGYSRRFPLSNTQVIGRGDSVDVFIPDMSTSRTHARLFFKGDKWIIEDMGSSLGTFINGVKVKKAEVDLSTEIRFGEGTSYKARLVCLDEKDKVRLAMLSNIFSRLTTDFNIREVLDCIIQSAIALIQAERGLILFLQENSLQPRIYIARDAVGNAIEIDVLKLSEGTISRVLKEGKPLFSTNLEEDDDAEDVLSKESERGSLDSQGYYIWGMSLYKRGQYPPALEKVEKSLELDKKNFKSEHLKNEIQKRIMK